MNIEAQKNNFKNHIATLTKYDNITILDFANPENSNYKIRFIFEEDTFTLHISGDLGYLTAFNPTNMCFEHFSDFTHNLGYFREKIKSHSRYLDEYDEKDAEKELREILEEYDPEDLDLDGNETDMKDEKIEEIISDVLQDFDYREGIGAHGYDALSEIDPDCFEYYDGLGRHNSGILELYMLAFELATTQLKERGLLS